jgi:simple sugar transport system ATP-binding protein
MTQAVRKRSYDPKRGSSQADASSCSPLQKAIPSKPGHSSWSRRAAERLTENAVPIVLLAIVVVTLASFIDDFFSQGNLLPALRQFGEIGFVALGMLIVVVVGGIDLSVGAIYALCNFAALLLVQDAQWPVAAAIPVVIALGLVLGLFNGYLVGVLRLRAFLTTLISIVIFRALYDILVARYGNSVTSADIPDSDFWNFLAFGEIWGLGLPFWLCILTGAAIHVILTRTRLGWHIMAIGGSRRAAHNAGVPVTRTVVLCYGVSGALTSVSSIFYAARLGDLSSLVGLGLEVKVLTGVIAGGILLGGGRGSVLRALVGLLIVLLLVNGLTEMSFPGGATSLVLAILLLVASSAESLIARRRPASKGGDEASKIARRDDGAGETDVPAATEALDASTQRGDKPETATLAEPVLVLNDARKSYGPVPAVDGVSLSLYPGKVHGLLGENGAGKSTLAKSMAGVVSLSSGEIRIDGKIVQPATPRQALELGIAMVFQESSLVPTSTVAQNLFLGHEAVYNNLQRINDEASRILQSLNFGVDPATLVSELSAAQRQMVEIARAVLHNARVLIFDEPTTSLTLEEKRYFFRLLEQLKAQGVSIVFITHAIEDALQHCDHITIMRDGKHILTDDADRLDLGRVIHAMIGRSLSDTMYGQKKSHFRAPGEKVLEVRGLTMTRSNSAPVNDSSFFISTGQVTGIFGLVGAGRTETFKVVAGLLARDRNGGEVLLHGRQVRYSSPADAVRDGIAYVTEDRKIEGFFQTMTSTRNIYMGLLAKLGTKRNWVSSREETALGVDWMKRLSVRSTNKDARVVELSGGNQQKVVIARSLVQNPNLIILDEPTKGVDVGAIAEIHALIDTLADQGKAVVVISSYLPEILAISDRVLVAKKGKIVSELTGAGATEDNIMLAAVH